MYIVVHKNKIIAGSSTYNPCRLTPLKCFFQYFFYPSIFLLFLIAILSFFEIRPSWVRVVQFSKTLFKGRSTHFIDVLKNVCLRGWFVVKVL